MRSDPRHHRARPVPARISIAALACYKPGQRSWLIYRPRLDARPDGRKSFAWSDYRDLLIAAHWQLGGPIVLIWDNLNTHLTAGKRAFITDQDWLTVAQLPIYTPTSTLSRASGRCCGTLPVQRRLRQPRTPEPHRPARIAHHPIPQRPHRRLPRGNWPAPHASMTIHDITSSISVTDDGFGCCVVTRFLFSV